MTAINLALASCNAEHPVFYEDEVDIHLNPKIGADWQLRGQHKRVVTPGQNEKYYFAGALHSSTGKVSYVGGNSKSSALFINRFTHRGSIMSNGCGRLCTKPSPGIISAAQCGNC